MEVGQGGTEQGAAGGRPPAVGSPPQGQPVPQGAPAAAPGQQQAPAPDTWSQSARENFAALEKKVKDYESKIQANEAILVRLRSAFAGDEGGQNPDEEFFASPSRAVDARVAQAEAKLAGDMERRMVLSELRATPGFTQEIEGQMAAVIRDYGLSSLGSEKAVRLAFKHVTGKEFGEAVQRGYETRSLKERLARPGSGMAGKQDSRQSLMAELEAAGAAKDGKKEKEVYEKLQAMYAEE